MNVVLLLKTACILPLIAALSSVGAADRWRYAREFGVQGSNVESLAIIVHKSNPVSNLSLDELRRVFMSEQGYWPQRSRVAVVMREQGQPERSAVLRSVFRMTEREYARFVLQAEFTEKSFGPKVVSSSMGMLRFVHYVTGGIGYVRAGDVDDSVKVLRIDGAAPGEPGYKLNLIER